MQPHDHQHVLGRFKGATQADAQAAVKAAADAAPDWRGLPMDDRCAVLLKAADLLAGPVAAADQRRHDARPVQDGVPGRDRHAPAS